MSQHRVYVGPFDEVEVLGRTVRHGDQIEVDAEQAERLDDQPENWAKPQTKAAKEADK